MQKKHDAILIDPQDNVAVAIKDLRKGKKVLVKGEGYHSEIELTRDIAFGHKLSVIPLERDAEIIKYGEVIGKALQDIPAGEHVHDHNIIGLRGKRNAQRREEA